MLFRFIACIVLSLSSIYAYKTDKLSTYLLMLALAGISGAVIIHT